MNIPRYRRETPEAAISRITGGVAGAGDGDEFERRAFASILGGISRPGARGGGVASSLAPTAGRPSRPGVGPPLSKAAHRPAVARVAGDSSSSELQAQRELATALTERLRVVESSQRKLRSELAAKDSELLGLRREVAELRAAQERARLSGDELGSAQEESASLRRERNALQKQVADMEAFLNEYGLVWVGSDGNGGTRPGEASTPTSYTGFDLALDFGVLAARVRELNALAGGEGAKKVVTRGGVSRLEEAESVPLTVWKDGLMLWRGPFRPVASEEAQAFLRDVLDGFFPSELKERYADGVLFKLIDKSSLTFAEDKAASGGAAPPSGGFAGRGRAMGSRPSGAASGAQGGDSEQQAGSNLLAAASAADRPGVAKMTTLADVGEAHLSLAGPMGKEAFLAQMPASVVRSGRVIKVREGLGDLMGASSAAERPDVVIARTPVVEALRGTTGSDDGSSSGDTHALMSSTFRPAPLASEGQDAALSSDDKVTTLVIRSDSGRQTLVVKLRYDDTVGDLRAYVDRYRAKSSSYDLVTAFPRRAYTDASQTLQDAGLVPNAKLMIQTRSRE
ncbi:hypothetical protein FNF29_07314 [Cafeteria roenbergensis]|uniref:UBX domain-containing protein 11 n=1 Tax=Cafeteria roenbergensis TaxID=33653 RepID=A0A5A8C3F9_CAFRO|nr:hypothetical protein FNF29_07314 [Cafeteria roenbergensis]|eukprot:KAA0147468.1 hypothetical protein FNF29_07314 [Cafeteria roenbergensis]